MVKWLALTGLSALIWWGVSPQPAAIAQNCRTNCRSDQIQFTPGQRVRVQIVNRTYFTVQTSQMAYMNPRFLLPGEQITLDFGAGTKPDLSLLFWEAASAPLRVRLARPQDDMLRVEIWAAPYGPGDRAIAVLNDGRVLIY